MGAILLHLLTASTPSIYEGMKDLCMRFCKEELHAALQGDRPVTEIQTLDSEQGDRYYDREEPEEQE